MLSLNKIVVYLLEVNSNYELIGNEIFLKQFLPSNIINNII